MKKLTKILSLLLVFALALSTMACSSFGKIERALKNDGYTLLIDKLDVQKEYEKVEGVTEAHVFTKRQDNSNGIPTYFWVYVLEFKSTQKMINYVNKDETLKGKVTNVSKNDDAKTILTKYEKVGIACNDCLIITEEDYIYKMISGLND